MRPWQRGGTFDVVAFAASVVTAFSMRARGKGEGWKWLQLTTTELPVRSVASLLLKAIV